MKTSQLQFDLMVKFMEKNGDLSRVANQTGSRMRNLLHWDELTHILNEAGGEVKTTEKWKKVWSDFKNNTKKKALRIRKATTGGANGPVYAKINELESRVLIIMDKVASTDLADKTVATQETTIVFDRIVDSKQEDDIQYEHCKVYTIKRPQSLSHDMETLYEHDSTHVMSPPQIEVTVSPNVKDDPDAENPDLSNEPDSDSSVPMSPLQLETVSLPTVKAEPNLERLEEIEETIAVSRKTPSPPLIISPSRQHSPRTYRGQRHIITRPSPRKRSKPTHTDQAAQHFLRSDFEWRKFKMQQHRDNIILKREQNRIREMELQTHKEWQAITSKALDLFNIIVNKYQND